MNTNTIRDAQGTFAVNLNKWFFATVFSVAIGSFLTIIIGFLSGWSNPTVGISLWFVTSLCCLGAQVVVIKSAFHIQRSRWLPWLLVSSIPGWAVSLLLVYPLIRLATFTIDSTKLGLTGLNGFIAGGIIGLFPGLFIGIAYWWLIGSNDNAEYLILSNVLGWFVGVGLAFAGIFVLVSNIASRMLPIF